MNNDDLLKKIEKLFEVERKQTRQLIREENEAVEKRLTAKIDSVDMKVEAFNHKLDTTAKEIKETIEREAKASSDLFLDTFEKLDKQEKLEKRMERVEKRLDLPQL